MLFESLFAQNYEWPFILWWTKHFTYKKWSLAWPTDEFCGIQLQVETFVPKIIATCQEQFFCGKSVEDYPLRWSFTSKYDN